jgi:hypothetical protein
MGVYIPSNFDYINKVSGYIVIAYDKHTYFTENPSTHLWSFHIMDNDLTKQQQIKEIRNAAKAGRGTLSKEDIAKKFGNIYIFLFILHRHISKGI